MYHTEEFKKFLRVQKNLSASTIKNHTGNAKVFLEYINDFTKEDIQDFMFEIKGSKSSQTHENYLSTLKILFRDYEEIYGKADLKYFT